MNPVDTRRHTIKETLTLPFLRENSKNMKLLIPSRKKPLSNCSYRTPLLSERLSFQKGESPGFSKARVIDAFSLMEVKKYVSEILLIFLADVPTKTKYIYVICI